MQLDRLNRREFITVLGGASSVWPLAAGAQQSSSILIGFLNASSAAAFTEEMDAFRDGLRTLGYVEGRNVRLEYRFAGGDLDKLPVLATELVRLSPKIMVSFALPATVALANATNTWRLALTQSASA
jgi:putative ABC transport system substrate-binding protein